MKKLYFYLSILLMLFSTFIQSQTTKEEFFSDIKHASGVYQPYIYVNTPVTQVPEGYKPFYISHYGRHGSRWLDSPESYTNPQNILIEAHKAGKLTAFGESLYERVNIIATDAEGRYGDVSHLGIIEHKGIAERMYGSFPEVFSTKNGRKCYIYSRSTVVPRCILSMAANNERLKELNPEINIEREAAKKYNYLNNSYKHPKRDSVNTVSKNFIAQHFDVKRFMASVFNDTVYTNEYIKDPVSFVSEIYYLAADIEDVAHLKLSMSDVFSKDDLFILWQASNIKLYNVFTSKAAVDSSKKLLKNILDCADNAIKSNNISADLRFGHDSYIAPLLALMEINGANSIETNPEKVYLVWSDFKVTPMGVNLQLIFYKNAITGEVIVKLLHNEKETEIPITSDIAPYYYWKDFKTYYENKLTE
ncbi:MAG: histidine-type phosphatase [bacterium]